MYKFLVALFLLYVPASMSALAHSGTDQEEKACTRDVQRFCRETALWLLHDAGGLMAVLWMTGHWAGQALVEGGIPFSGGSSNGGFWSRKVENALSFNGN